MSDNEHAHHADGLAPSRNERARCVRDLRRPGRQPRHVVPRDARHGERAADPRRQGADRVRPRLPRGHLRFLRNDDQRHPARSRARHRDVPAAHAQVPRRRSHHDRAVARGGVPDRQGPDLRPHPARPDRRVGRLHLRAAPAARPTRNLIPIPKPVADAAMDAAACIGCGACVAACPNGAAQLFTSAKLEHLNLLPQGQAERWDRTIAMVETMESYFGSCTNHRECEAACPEVDLDRLHRADEQGLRQGAAQAAPPRRPVVPVDDEDRGDSASEEDHHHLGSGVARRDSPDASHSVSHLEPLDAEGADVGQSATRALAVRGVLRLPQQRGEDTVVREDCAGVVVARTTSSEGVAPRSTSRMERDRAAKALGTPPKRSTTVRCRRRTSRGSGCTARPSSRRPRNKNLPTA